MHGTGVALRRVAAGSRNAIVFPREHKRRRHGRESREQESEPPDDDRAARCRVSSRQGPQNAVKAANELLPAVVWMQ